MGRGVGELQNALELTCNVSCTLLCIHATAAFPLSSPLNLMVAIGDLFSALLPFSAISATCLRDCQLLLDCCIFVAVSSSPPPPSLSPTPYSCYPLLTLQSLSLSLSLVLLIADDHKLPWVFSSVGWKAWPDSCRWWISVLVHCGRQQIDIITAAKPLERWRRGRQVHTTTVGADRSTHGRRKRRRSYERRRRDRRKKKPTKNTYCNKLRANSDTQKKATRRTDSRSNNLLSVDAIEG